MKTDYQMQIILKLRVLREKNHLTQTQTAFFLGISPGQLGNIESNKQNHKYTLKQIYLLCDKMGTPISSLFCEDDESDFNKLIQNIIKYEENDEK